MANKDRYKQFVEPNLDKIAKMAETMTQREIADALHVGYSTFKTYIAKHKPLKDALNRAVPAKAKLGEGAILRLIEGYFYEETKVIEELDKESGDMVITRRETFKKYMPPSVAAVNLFNKNYLPGWANDPQALELRKRELELQERKIEEQSW